MKKQESEFGKGFVYCLFLFAKHWWRHLDQITQYKEMRTKNPELFSEKDALSLWFNGAADHLIQLTIPQSLKGTKIAEQARALQTKALSWRLTFGESGPSLEDFNRFFDDMEKLCMEIDKKLGCKPIEAQWK